MRKRTAQPTRTGQMTGAEIKIGEVHNDALHEHVTVVNRGTVAQPLGGWALATLRGERIFFFPDDLILRPGMRVTVHSGHARPRAPATGRAPLDLLWTDEQMWNNRRDVAVLFDANGDEMDRYAYPPERPLRRVTHHRKQLVRNGETWRIVDEPRPEMQSGPRKDKRAPRR
jgi:hypothetical protein